MISGIRLLDLHARPSYVRLFLQNLEFCESVDPHLLFTTRRQRGALRWQPRLHGSLLRTATPLGSSYSFGLPDETPASPS